MKSKNDPLGKCVASISIKWEPHFACGSYAPTLTLESEQLKFIAIRPDILAIFLKMEHGSMLMKDVLIELDNIGTRKDFGNYLVGNMMKDEIEDKRITSEFERFMNNSDATKK